MSRSRDEHRQRGEAHREVQDLFQLASLESDRSNYDKAVSYLEEARRLSRDIDFQLGVLLAEAGLGGIDVNLQRYDRARRNLELACQALRELGEEGDEAALVSCLSHLGRVAQAEDNRDEAISLTRESLALMGKLGDTRGRASALISLARMVQDEEDGEQSKRLRAESLELSERLGDRFGVASAKLEQGRFDQTRPVSERRALLRQSLESLSALGEMRGVTENLEALASVQLREAPAAAATLYSAADALRTAIPFPLWQPGDIERHRQLIAFLRETLGEEEFAASWAAGKDRPLQEIVCQALDGLAQL